MTDVSPSGPVFKTADTAARFFAAYDAVLAQWPVTPQTRELGTPQALDVPSAYGTTRVHACGPPDGPPLILLHGGGATSTVWFANVGELSRTYRVYAVDTIGDAGRSVHNRRPTRTVGDFMEWLDSLLDGLGIDSAHVAGHSYGSWIGLHYALHAPQRVRKLVLLDPTDCFAGLALTYRLRAVPLFVGRTPDRIRAFFEWEAGDIAVNQAWLNLVALTAEFPQSKIVMPRHPAAEKLRASTVPTLVLLAEQSRAHNVARVAANARTLMPRVTIAMLPGATHHSVPTEHPAEINRHVLEFLA
jgi:pimeloyl-ACP methyl ester carboxylesterase